MRIRIRFNKIKHKLAVYRRKLPKSNWLLMGYVDSASVSNAVFGQATNKALRDQAFIEGDFVPDHSLPVFDHKDLQQIQHQPHFAEAFDVPNGHRTAAFAMVSASADRMQIVATKAHMQM